MESKEAVYYGMQCRVFGRQPAGFGNLKSLLILKNCLTSFPEFICSLKTLTSLSIERGPLSQISPRISNLTILEKLKLNNQLIFNKIYFKTNIATIPREIGQMHTLRSLILGYNIIDGIPESINNLLNLKILLLNDNRITESALKLECVPDFVLRQTNLKRLYIANNLLKDLSANFHENLQNTLEMTTGSAQFPSEIKYLKSLITLILKEATLLTFPTILI